MFIKLYKSVLSILVLASLPLLSEAQKDNDPKHLSPPVNTQSNPDSISNEGKDTTIVIKKKTDFIETQVQYNATDSIVMSRDGNKVYLYNDAEINYGEINLTAGYIEYDQEKNQVFAKGVLDSLGNETQLPVFQEGAEKFDAKTIEYNFKTKKAYVEQVFTQEQDGYLHSKITKKDQHDNLLIKGGKYTTCDHEDPHFYLALTKAKAIPGDKIVSSYSYLVIADLPLYIVGIPFGYFPTKQERSSGILIPTYGEESNRGFYLRNGGYYFGINDRMDLALTGDIYSRGTWGGNLTFRYKKRYKAQSNLVMSYYENVTGEEGYDEARAKDMAIRWNFTQDPKANPTSKFSASVNYSTSSYDMLHKENINQRINNTKSSNIAYSKNWPGSPFRLNTNFRHSQNSSNNKISFTLPSLNFNMDRVYPFRELFSGKSTKKKWYDDIEISYQSQLENKLETLDTLLFTDTEWEDFRYGFKHSIPIKTNIKALKIINISPQVKYTGILYQESIIDNVDTLNKVYTDTIPGLDYAHMIEPSISIGLSPKAYMRYDFTSEKFPVKAIRHVMTPSVSFSYRPDLGSMVEQYYGTYTDTSNRTIEYNRYRTGLYRLPAAPGEYGAVSLSFGNNLEMKVRTPNDTVNKEKKIKLLESLNFSTSYNLFADSMNWAPIRMTGRTNLFENKVTLNFNATFDPYALNKDGQIYNEYVWNARNQGANYLRFTHFDAGISFNLGSKKGDKNKGNQGQDQFNQTGFEDPLNQDPMSSINRTNSMLNNTYVDFDIPWQLRVEYKFIYSKPKLKESEVIKQTLRFSGNVSLTKKWKVSVNSSYDFETGKLAATSINIHRDLHCWEATFNWIPIGQMKSFNFRINVRSSVLQDLKMEKKSNWRDNNTRSHF